MDLIINFKDRGKVELQLKRGRVLTDTLTFDFEANLDLMLISAVDKILKRNRIDTSSLKTATRESPNGAVAFMAIKATGKVNKDSSAYKIVQTFMEAIKSR